MLPCIALVVLLSVAGGVRAQGCCAGMTMNSLGLQLTESSEGFVDHVYNDAVGNPTCCYGHLVTSGQTFPNPIPYSTCVLLLQQDLGSAEQCVQNSVNVPLNSNQFSALVDFTFNLGCGALQSSTLLRLLNEGNYAAVPAQMMRWVHAGGQVLPGLVTRRQKEGQLWNTPEGAASTAAPAAGTTAAPAPASTQPPAPASTQPPTQPATQPTTTTDGGFFSWLGSRSGQAPASSSSSSGMPGYGIALIVVGCAALVAVVGVAVAKFRKPVTETSVKREQLSEGLLEAESTSEA